MLEVASHPLHAELMPDDAPTSPGLARGIYFAGGAGRLPSSVSLHEFEEITMSGIKLWGFSNSTYVRTIRMVLAEKGVADYEQVPLNVLAGEPRSAEHRERHPFGKVPVLDHDGMRIIETTAIANYLNAVLPGKSVVPSDPKDRARMDMVVGIIDSYGYGALIGGVVAYHLFPDFVGGKNEAMHRQGLEDGRIVLTTIMSIKRDAPFLAGAEPSVADFYLAPIMAYVLMTPHKDEVLALPRLGDWWAKTSALDSFRATDPS